MSHQLAKVYIFVQMCKRMHSNSRRFWLMGPHLILSFVVARTIQKALIFIPLFSQCVFLLLFIYYKECILRFITLVFPTRRCNSWSTFSSNGGIQSITLHVMTFSLGFVCNLLILDFICLLYYLFLKIIQKKFQN